METLTSNDSSLMEAADTGLSFSNLMGLASLDTSDMQAQLSRLPREGIYISLLKKIGFTEQPPSDPAKPMNYQLGFTGEILAFNPLKPEEASGQNPEGQNLTERFFVYGENIQEAIQLIMGRYKTVGFRHKGIMGGVEGSQAGWIDEALNRRVAIRVTHFTSKDGQERARFDWLSPKQMDKHGITWEMMGRDFLNETGTPIDPKDAWATKKSA